MTIADSREIRTMRSMAWRRAKGELRAVLATFWDDLTIEEFEELEQLVKTFTVKFALLAHNIG